MPLPPSVPYLASSASHDEAIRRIADLASGVGVRRVHLLAWRDLDDPEAGGSEVHAATVASIWAEAGVDVVMRTSFAAGHPPEIDRDSYRVVRRAGRYLLFPRAAMAEILRNHGPREAVVEIWNGMPFMSPVWTRSPKIVVLHHVHGEMWRMVLPPGLARLGNAIESRWAPAFYRDQRIVTLSESSKEEIVRDLGFSPSNVTVVPPGVDRRFCPDPSRTLDAGAPPPSVVAVGRLVPVKRFDVLIRACHEVRETVPDLRLTIVGQGYEHLKLQRLVQRLGATGWIEFAHTITDDELVNRYRSARVVASSSAREGWGMTLTEAAACGTPAVATRIAGHTDAVDDGVSGLLADDTAELVRHLRSVCTDDQLWAKLARGAQAHAARFTWDATAVGLMDALAGEVATIGRRGRAGRWR